jgi:hypothetical protein
MTRAPRYVAPVALWFVLAVGAACGAVRPGRPSVDGLDSPVAAPREADASDDDGARPTLTAAASLDDAAPPAPPARRPPPSLTVRACDALLAQRRALIAKGTARCTNDDDCGTYVDVRHPCGDGAIDKQTASAIDRFDEQLLGDVCYVRRSGQCRITPYLFHAECASSGRCAVR